MKHTQGDWFLVHVNDGQDNDEIMARVNGCLVSIAAVSGPCEYSEAVLPGEHEPKHAVTKEESQANAMLLTNAARMYAALERIAHGVEDGASLSGTDCAEIAEQILAEVRAV
jgi:hypothetical protein